MISSLNFWAVPLLLLILIVGASGQEAPGAVLVDEFGKISCENFLSRNDYFLSELANNPQDIGYAIIYANDRYATGFVRFIEASLFIRRFDRGRIEIVVARAPNERGVAGSFWRVPPGAEPPIFDRVEMPVPDLTRPFIVGTTSTDNVCPSFSADTYAQLVVDNPGSRARIVISGPSSRWRRSTANEELEIFRQYTKLPRNRIELYFVHRTKDSYTTTEYWFIPAKR